MNGIAAIEFAMLALPFFLLLFAILETSLVFLGELTLDQAVEQMGRQVRIGAVKTDSPTEEKFREALCEEVRFLLRCGELKIDLKAYEDFSAVPRQTPLKDGEVDDESFEFDPGAPNTIMALRVYYNWPIRIDFMRAYLSDMADGSHLIASTAIFRTEPFR